MGLESVLALVRRTAGGAVDADAPLMEAGVDSLGAVELRKELLRAVGECVELSSTLIFDHPTARQVATHLQGRQPGAADNCTRDAALASAGGQVEIVGLSLLLPQHVSELREMIYCGCDLLGTIPLTRWDVKQAALDLAGSPPEVASRIHHGGFLRDAELFARNLFGISTAEATAMDPQQRQLLERGYLAFHAAGMSKPALLGAVVGVNVGQWASEFGSVLLGTPAGRGVYASTGFSCSVTCGRVSFVLGLHGPCASYDTACSASLVASHSSVRALQHAECVSALSAGVNMMFDPAVMRGHAVVGFTSITGRSHTFDVRADGYARGEAIGAVSCRLGAGDDAMSSSAKMVGSAVRQDGRSVSLTAPNGRAQEGVLGASLADARLEPNALTVLEAHGTGTALGDPIELGAVAAIFLARREGMQESMRIGSLKANAGHTEPGAGLAGALKLVMQLRDMSVSPNAQLRVLNPHVGGALRGVACGLSVQLAAAVTGAGSGGVSSFGYAGTIAHAVQRRAVAAEELALFQLPLAYCRHGFAWREPPHPFAQRRLASSDGATAVFRSPAAGALHALVADHVVSGRVVFPGAGYLEMARAGGAATLRGVYFVEPLAIEAADLLVECSVVDGRFEVRSGAADAMDDDATVHCSGATGIDATWQHVEHASLRTSVPCAADVGTLYDGFHAVGLQYGPGYRTLVQAWGGRRTALARLRTRLTLEGTRTQVHPADLDDALCTSAVIGSSGGDSETRLPFAVDEALLRGPASGALLAVSGALSSKH